jgi:uncharacterized protein (TIGR02757 family)
MGLKRSYRGVPAADLKKFLDDKYFQFNNRSFIECDPISIPHRYTGRADREIAGFLAATIAWGRRDLIIRSCGRMMELMEDSPYQFITNAADSDLERFEGFVYRTFNGVDCKGFMRCLKHIYLVSDSMEDIIVRGMKNGGSLRDGLSELRTEFFSAPHVKRTEKHFADISAGAAGKRLLMFLRWMVREDSRGVDFGIWKKIRPSQLYMPLDIHSGNTARKLGILKRKMNDWKAVEELTDVLRNFDPEDPVKYDFALFGLGVFEGFASNNY